MAALLGLQKEVRHGRTQLSGSSQYVKNCRLCRAPILRVWNGASGQASERTSGARWEPGKQERQEQPAALKKPGLDPKLVVTQPNLQAMAHLLRSLPPGQLSSAALGAALCRVERHVATAGGDAAEAAAAQSLVELAWGSLGTMHGGDLVKLLAVTAKFVMPTQPQMAAWLAALEACEGIYDLFPYHRVDLLDLARRLAAAPGGAAIHLPRRLLGSNLARVCRPSRAGRLSLAQLTKVYRSARELGLSLTADQHMALAAAAKDLLGPGQPPMGLSLSELVNVWAGMERDYLSWRAEAERLRSTKAQGAGGQVAAAGQGTMAQAGTQRVTGAQQQVQLRRQPPQQQQQQQLEPPPPQEWQLEWQLEHWPQWQGVWRQQEEQRFVQWSLTAESPGCFPASEGPESSGPARPQYQPLTGYPGDDVMEAVVRHLHFHRRQMNSWTLGQVLGALGTLRYAPPQHVVVDLAEALAPQLASREQSREATAAVAGLARLGLDPGEALQEACLRLALEDGGEDQQLLATVAWALTLFQRCTPEQWQALVALWRPVSFRDKAAPSDERDATWWLTAYRLMLARHPAVAPLPAPLVGQGVARARATCRDLMGTERWWLHQEAAQVLRQLCGSRLKVVEGYRIEDSVTGAPMMLDLAVPQLRFGLRVCRRHEVTRNTFAPLGNTVAVAALARGAGWEVAALPPAGALASKEGLGGGDVQQGITAFLLKHTRLLQVLAGPWLVWQKDTVGWDLGSLERCC